MALVDYVIDPLRTCGLTTCVPDIIEDWTLPTVFSYAGKSVRLLTCWMGPLAPAGDALGSLLEQPAVGGLAHFVVACAVMRQGRLLLRQAQFQVRAPETNAGALLGTPYVVTRPGGAQDLRRGLAYMAGATYFGLLPSARSLFAYDWQKV